MATFFRRIFTNKKMFTAGLSLLLAVSVLILAVIAVFPLTKAWFASNRNVGASGISLSVKQDKLSFGDTFTARAVMNDVTVATGNYSRGNDGKYYLVDENGEQITENGKPKTLFYDSLFPGEYIEMTFRIRCTEDLVGTGYRMYFEGLSGSETFTTKPTDGSEPQECSILGVFRLGVITQYDETGAPLSETETDKGFLSSYTSESSSDTAEILTATWESADFIDVTLRLHVDLTQYYALEGTYSNLLSEKRALIDRIVLEPWDGVQG